MKNYLVGGSAMVASKVGQNGNADLQHRVDNVVVSIAFGLLEWSKVYMESRKK